LLEPLLEPIRGLASAALPVLRNDFSARFAFVRLIGRIYLNLPVESRASPPGGDTARRLTGRSTITG